MSRKLGNFELKLNFKRILIKMLPLILLVALYVAASYLGIVTASGGFGIVLD